MRFAGAIVVVALSSGTAAADYKDDLERAAGAIKQTPPRAGVEQAPAASGARPGWCGPLTEAPYLGGLESHLGGYYSKPEELYKLLAAADALCKNDTAQPVIKLATREIVQLWMNAYGLSAADVVESFKLKLTAGADDAGERKTCDALAIDDELGGADRAFLVAKRHLFGCSIRIQADSLVEGRTMEKAVPWLDSSAKPPDELVRLSYVYNEATAITAGFEYKTDYATKMLLTYVTAQFDFRALDAKAALQALDNDPLLKGNTWARVTVKERIGYTRLALLAVEEAVKTKTEKSPEWKEILITAPQRGHKAYLDATARYKAELQRSAEVEGLLFGASRKAMAGCKKTIEPDLAAVLKTLKRETAQELSASINAHPVAGLLFRRFQACVAVDGHVDAAREMHGLETIRVLRGPRAAAYFAAIDAIETIRADRAQFPVAVDWVPFARDTILHQLTYKLFAGGDQTAFHFSTEQGVIKTMKKGAGGTTLVFNKDKQERWSQSCKPTKRIVTYEHDGDPVYDNSCSGGKVVKVDVSPEPVVVPDSLAAGLAPGRLVSFGVATHGRKAMPFEVYKDKKGKNLVAWMTIGL